MFFVVDTLCQRQRIKNRRRDTNRPFLLPFFVVGGGAYHYYGYGYFVIRSDPEQPSQCTTRSPFLAVVLLQEKKQSPLALHLHLHRPVLRARVFTMRRRKGGGGTCSLVKKLLFDGDDDKRCVCVFISSSSC
jgi:hypothetical protein